MQQPKQFHLEFKWSAPLDPLMTKSNLFGVASDESEDGLTREHSTGSDHELLWTTLGKGGRLVVARAMHNTLKVFALCLVRVSCSRPQFWAGRKFT